MRKTSTTIVAGLFLALATLAARAQAPLDREPSAANLADWLAFIRPSEQELAWEEIGWRNEFWPAVEEARRLGRPILLWTMNGHPLGCT
ncbi:MAG: hypothetical protein H6807_04970 [Planctomycetes bacterium]|nr:hypothetical protein [Planctomycetota bacterium]